MILSEQTSKVTTPRESKTVVEKRPIDNQSYYTIRDITNKESPYFICSPSTVFKALRKGTLKANYINRKVLLKGSAIHQWIDGEEGGDHDS